MNGARSARCSGHLTSSDQLRGGTQHRALPGATVLASGSVSLQIAENIFSVSE